LIVVAAVPAKDFRDAKHRLVGILTPGERAGLARVMLEDVLGVVSAGLFHSVYVVTGDAEVIACARQFRVEIIAEERSAGHTAAVSHAQAVALATGADCFLTIPGDVPDVTAAELRALVDAARADRAVVLVPSLSGLGTNGVLLRPPDAMTLKFGEPSFENHLSVARALDLPVKVLRLKGLGLDIDTPDDLRTLLERGGNSRTAQFLTEIGAGRRAGFSPDPGGIQI
jgi:2-phospho-L-lactate guanylyltransferase